MALFGGTQMLKGTASVEMNSVQAVMPDMIALIIATCAIRLQVSIRVAAQALKHGTGLIRHVPHLHHHHHPAWPRSATDLRRIAAERYHCTDRGS